MKNALILFGALQTFDRPASRAELERESGLSYDQVHEGLRTLDRHRLLVKPACGERRRGLYQLIPDALKPASVRGRYERTAQHRQQVAATMRSYRAVPPAYSPARPATHCAEPGVLRTVKGSLNLRVQEQRGVFGHCALASLWKKR